MILVCFIFQAEDGIRDYKVTGVQTCALPIYVSVVVAAPKLQERATSLETSGKAQFNEEALARVHALVTGRVLRSEERRVGKEGRSRWSPYHLKKKKRNIQIM